MRIYWTDIGRSETPGSFMVGDGVVNIKERHISEWRRAPDGFWNTRRFVDVAEGNVQYGPTSFDEERLAGPPS